jgi:hypothetical protein
MCIFVSLRLRDAMKESSGAGPRYHKHSPLGFEPWTSTCAFVRYYIFCRNRYLEIPTTAKSIISHKIEVPGGRFICPTNSSQPIY